MLKFEEHWVVVRFVRMQLYYLHRDISMITLDMKSARHKSPILEPCIHAFSQQVFVKLDEGPGYALGRKDG